MLPNNQPQTTEPNPFDQEANNSFFDYWNTKPYNPNEPVGLWFVKTPNDPRRVVQGLTPKVLQSKQKPYWTVPKRVVRYKQLIDNAPDPKAIPEWVDQNKINSLYNYMEFINPNKPVDDWQGISPDDPNYNMALDIEQPPHQLLPGYETDLVSMANRDIAKWKSTYEGQVKAYNDLLGEMKVKEAETVEQQAVQQKAVDLGKLEPWEQALQAIMAVTPGENKPGWMKGLEIGSSFGKGYLSGMFTTSILTGVAGALSGGTTAGLPGAAIGTVAGLAMGGYSAYLAAKGDTAGANAIMMLFNKPAEWTEQILSVPHTYNELAKSGADLSGFDLADFLQAGKGYYETHGYKVGNLVANTVSDAFHFIDPTRNTGGQADEGYVWMFQKGFVEPQAIKEGLLVGNPMAESVIRLYNGEQPEMVYMDMVDRYGFSGTMADFLGQSVIDPMQFVPYLVTLGVEKIGRDMSMPDLARAARQTRGNVLIDALPSFIQIPMGQIVTMIRRKTGNPVAWFNPTGGLFDIVDRYRVNVQSATPFFDGSTNVPKLISQMNRFEKTLAGIDNDTGFLKNTLGLDENGAIALKREANILKGKDPVGEVSLIKENFFESQDFVWDRSQLSFDQYVEELGKVMAGDAAVKVGDATTYVYGSAKSRTVAGSLKLAVQGDDLKTDVMLWRNSKKARDLIADLARGLELQPNDIVAKLTAGQFTELLDAYKAKAVPGALLDQINKGVLTPEKLKLRTATMIRNNIPFSDLEMYVRYKGKLEANLNSELSRMYQVPEESTVFKLGRLNKSVQSLLLLGLNPSFLTKNFMNNIVTMSYQRLGSQLYTDKANAAIFARYGAEIPYRAKEGYTMEGIPRPRKDNPKGLIDNAQALVGGLSSRVGVISKWSGQIEEKAGFTAAAVGFQTELMRRMVEGDGIVKMSDELKQGLIAEGIQPKAIIDAIKMDPHGVLDATAPEPIKGKAKTKPNKATVITSPIDTNAIPSPLGDSWTGLPNRNLEQGGTDKPDIQLRIMVNEALEKTMANLGIQSDAANDLVAKTGVVEAFVGYLKEGLSADEAGLRVKEDYRKQMNAKLVEERIDDFDQYAADDHVGGGGARIHMLEQIDMDLTNFDYKVQTAQKDLILEAREIRNKHDGTPAGRAKARKDANNHIIAGSDTINQNTLDHLEDVGNKLLPLLAGMNIKTDNAVEFVRLIQARHELYVQYRLDETYAYQAWYLREGLTEDKPISWDTDIAPKVKEITDTYRAARNSIDTSIDSLKVALVGDLVDPKLMDQWITAQRNRKDRINKLQEKLTNDLLTVHGVEDRDKLRAECDMQIRAIQIASLNSNYEMIKKYQDVTRKVKNDAALPVMGGSPVETRMKQVAKEIESLSQQKIEAEAELQVSIGMAGLADANKALDAVVGRLEAAKVEYANIQKKLGISTEPENPIKVIDQPVKLPELTYTDIKLGRNVKPSVETNVTPPGKTVRTGEEKVSGAEHIRQTKQVTGGKSLSPSGAFLSPKSIEILNSKPLQQALYEQHYQDYLNFKATRPDFDVNNPEHIRHYLMLRKVMDDGLGIEFSATEAVIAKQAMRDATLKTKKGPRNIKALVTNSGYQLWQPAVPKVTAEYQPVKPNETPEIKILGKQSTAEMFMEEQLHRPVDLRIDHKFIYDEYKKSVDYNRKLLLINNIDASHRGNWVNKHKPELLNIQGRIQKLFNMTDEEAVASMSIMMQHAEAVSFRMGEEDPYAEIAKYDFSRAKKSDFDPEFTYGATVAGTAFTNFDPEAGKWIIKASQEANATSWLHEMAHTWLFDLDFEDTRTVSRYLGYKDVESFIQSSKAFYTRKLNENGRAQYSNNVEQWVKAFEYYYYKSDVQLSEEQLSSFNNPAMKSAIGRASNNFKKWIVGLYEKIGGNAATGQAHSWNETGMPKMSAEVERALYHMKNDYRKDEVLWSTSKGKALRHTPVRVQDLSDIFVTMNGGRRYKTYMYELSPIEAHDIAYENYSWKPLYEESKRSTDLEDHIMLIINSRVIYDNSQSVDEREARFARAIAKNEPVKVRMLDPEVEDLVASGDAYVTKIDAEQNYKYGPSNRKEPEYKHPFNTGVFSTPERLSELAWSEWPVEQQRIFQKAASVYINDRSNMYANPRIAIDLQKNPDLPNLLEMASRSIADGYYDPNDFYHRMVFVYAIRELSADPSNLWLQRMLGTSPYYKVLDSITRFEQNNLAPILEHYEVGFDRIEYDPVTRLPVKADAKRAQTMYARSAKFQKDSLKQIDTILNNLDEMVTKGSFNAEGEVKLLDLVDRVGQAKEKLLLAIDGYAEYVKGTEVTMWNTGRWQVEDQLDTAIGTPVTKAENQPYITDDGQQVYPNIRDVTEPEWKPQAPMADDTIDPKLSFPSWMEEYESRWTPEQKAHFAEMNRFYNEVEISKLTPSQRNAYEMEMLTRAYLADEASERSNLVQENPIREQSKKEQAKLIRDNTAELKREKASAKDANVKRLTARVEEFRKLNGFQEADQVADSNNLPKTPREREKLFMELHQEMINSGDDNYPPYKRYVELLTLQRNAIEEAYIKRYSAWEPGDIKEYSEIIEAYLFPSMTTLGGYTKHTWRSNMAKQDIITPDLDRAPKADALTRMYQGAPDPLNNPPEAIAPKLNLGKVMQDFEPDYERIVNGLVGGYKKADPTIGFKLPADMDPNTKAMLAKWFKQSQDAWHYTKAGAIEYGMAQRDHALLNYNDRSSMDRYLELAFPYQFWFTRTAAEWAKRAVSRPAIVAQAARAQAMAEKLGRGTGTYPSRLQGKMRIPWAFKEDWMGDALYINPAMEFMPINQLLSPLTTSAQKFQSMRPDMIIVQMVQDKEISQEEADQALKDQSGPIWEQAMATAVNQQREQENPMDLVSQFLTPNMALKEIYSGFTKTKQSNLPQTNLSLTLKSHASSLNGADQEGTVAYGVNQVVNHLGNVLEWPEKVMRGNNFAYYGKWDEYLIKREVSNMAGEGEDVTEVLKAMIEMKGPLWDKAFNRVRDQVALRMPGSLLAKTIGEGYATQVPFAMVATLFPAGIYPEGELEMLGLKEDLQKAWDAAGKDYNTTEISDWHKEHPEYMARSGLNDDPETMLKKFMVNQIMDVYTSEAPINKGIIKEHLGPDFIDAILDNHGEGIDFKALDLQKLANWTRTLNGQVPKTDQTAELDIYKSDMPTYKPEEIKALTAYFDEREAKFPDHAWQNEEYFNIQDDTQKKIFMAKNPELADYWQWNKTYKASNKIVKDWSDKYSDPAKVAEDPYYGVSEEKIKAYYDYRARTFPNATWLNTEYFKIPEENRSGRRAFLNKYPELQKYWDAKKLIESQDPEIAYYNKMQDAAFIKKNAIIKPPASLKPQQTAKALAVLQLDNYVKQDLLDYYVRGTELPFGTKAVLKALWEERGKPGKDFDDFVNNLF